MEQRFLLNFDLAPFHALDDFALIAEQDYNLGNKGDWFGCFRGGFHGVLARAYAVQRHYYEVHAWVPAPRPPVETEYHISTMFFGMDSAIECFVFALNALGWAASSMDFLDVSDSNALRRVAPWNIVGDRTKKPLRGYATYFPTLQQHWLANSDLLQTITDQHDVSKHRKTIYMGGQARLDPPHGFYEALGIADNEAAQTAFWPMEEILLSPDPKVPPAILPAFDAGLRLEDLAERFCDFMNQSCAKALSDATAQIKLSERRLRQP